MVNFECRIFNGQVFVVYIKCLDLLLICCLSVTRVWGRAPNRLTRLHSEYDRSPK